MASSNRSPAGGATGPRWPWEPFVWSAITIGLAAGFSLGGALFLARWLGVALGTWGPALAQIHGLAQLQGWAGLMILGVGLQFLPRLRGTPLVRPDLVPPAWGLFTGGLTLRILCQPAAIGLPPGPAAGLAGVGLTLAELLQLSGLYLILGLLIATFRTGPPLAERPALRGTFPFLIVGLGSFGLALPLSLIPLLDRLLPAATNWAAFAGAALDLMLDGCLVPLGIGMAMRTFPLYYRTRLPWVQLLDWALGAYLTGTLGRILSRTIDQSTLSACWSRPAQSASSSAWGSPARAGRCLAGQSAGSPIPVNGTL